MRLARLIGNMVRLALLFLRGKSDSAAVGKNLAIRVGILAINFGTGVIVARSLGPAGRGEQAAIALWPPFIATLATLGLPTALGFRSRRQPEDAKRLYMASVLVLFIVGVVAGVVGAAVMPRLLHGYDAQTVRVAQWFMLFAPESLVASAARAHLESKDQFSQSTLGYFYPTVATLVTLFILRFTGHLTPITAALSYSVPYSVQAVWVVIRLWNRTLFRFREFARDIRLLLPYGLQCYGVDIVSALSGQMDLVVIVSFLSPVALGLYTVALSLSRLLSVVYASVVTILFSRASSLASENAISLVERAARLSTAICMLLGLLLFLVLRFAVPIIYGRAFVAAMPLTALLIVEAILSGLVVVLYQAFMATGRPAIVTVVQVCWTAAAISLLFILVPRMNIAGAATALLAAAFVRLGVVMAAYPVILQRRAPSLILNVSDLIYVRDKFRRIRLDFKAIQTERAVGGV